MVKQFRYTFAVCVSCGCQSPPVVLNPGEPTEIGERLKDMGWKFDRLRFNVLAECPGCLANETAEETQQARMG